jgi:NADPH:quinone reductase-like Zn-dependent oxidoreductase
VNGNRPDLDVLSAMVTAAQLRPHIDATYSLDTVKAAHAHIEGKRTRGKVVVRMR